MIANNRTHITKNCRWAPGKECHRQNEDLAYKGGCYVL